MRLKIKEIKGEGKFISFMDCTELCIIYPHRNEVGTWSNEISVEVVEDDNLFWTHYIKNLEKGYSAIARKVQNYDLVPKSKFDLETVEKIKRADIKDIEPILPELFEWTEDPNWPIAKSLAIELAKLGEYIIPFVKYYLNNPEGLNEYCVYYDIMPLLNKVDLEALKEDLVRLATKPTEFEKDLEYDKFAQEYLDKLENI